MMDNGQPEHRLFDAPIDALKSGVHRLVERASTNSSGEPTRLRSGFVKATAMIQAHPVAAVAIAFGAGYVVMRISRRSS